jgi:hypothetical protein
MKATKERKGVVRVAAERGVPAVSGTSLPKKQCPLLDLGNVVTSRGKPAYHTGIPIPSVEKSPLAATEPIANQWVMNQVRFLT